MLLCLVFSWIYQRRPEEEQEALRRLLVDSQGDLALHRPEGPRATNPARGAVQRPGPPGAVIGADGP